MMRAAIAFLAASAIMAIVCLVGTQFAPAKPVLRAPDPDFDYLAAVRRRFPFLDADNAPARLDAFRLFNACKPMNLVVELHLDNAEARKLGLSSDRLRTAAESRLRAARLYEAGTTTHERLRITVGVAGHKGRAVGFVVGFEKWLQDRNRGEGYAETWRTGTIGTHGGDASYIVRLVGEHVDQFLVEYLRVNEGACEARDLLKADR